jgi:hypothetical protein
MRGNLGSPITAPGKRLSPRLLSLGFVWLFKGCLARPETLPHAAAGRDPREIVAGFPVMFHVKHWKKMISPPRFRLIGSKKSLQDKGFWHCLHVASDDIGSPGEQWGRQACLA